MSVGGSGVKHLTCNLQVLGSNPAIEKAGRGRVANGASSPLASPRRRGRPRADDVDHFTAFCTRAQQANYNVAVQIFQYLGMRDLAHSARVCKLWQQLASTPALWRHVRMKNSHYGTLEAVVDASNISCMNWPRSVK
ncbi:hypothetical protein RR48_01677 [Papilio machaon]|uniref:F-box domain-containing protein n=1 Tax=Papilio machaon TaxID=76193 RepID=A0A0N1IFA3_PAPMA|nr:hypothetical protein RR48_01677 [Papilio machaon]